MDARERVKHHAAELRKSLEEFYGTQHTGTGEMNFDEGFCWYFSPSGAPAAARYVAERALIHSWLGDAKRDGSVLIERNFGDGAVLQYRITKDGETQ